MGKAIKYAMIMWIRNRNRQRFVKSMERADTRVAVVPGGDREVTRLRKILVVEPLHKAGVVAKISKDPVK